MNNVDVSARKVACRAVFALGCFVFIQLVGARDARAESPRKVGGFDALGTLGYGFPQPFGVTMGVDLGYTLPFGLRIGADASLGLGRKSKETNSNGEEVVTDASSFAFGGGLGYDLLLPSSFRLRGGVDMGLALFSYEGGRIDSAFVPGGAWYIGPKVALLWQYRIYEFGLQGKYWVTTSDGVVQVQLMGGVRFF